MRNIRLKPTMVVKNQFSSIFPSYVYEEYSLRISDICYFYYKFLLRVIRFLFKLRLKVFGSHYKKYSGVPTHDEVEQIYTREARTYETKHHLTTNFRDTWWRRQVGLEIINHIKTDKKEGKMITLLDVCTGIGLSLEEMFKIFELFNVKVNAVGLDYSDKMLTEAKNVIYKRMEESGLLEKGVREVRFTKGDARNLTHLTENALETFPGELFDATTTMFGIGGVDSPLRAIKEQLLILKQGGILVITDIHKPIIELNEKWPWFIGKKHANAFAIMAWETATKPLALATLWGWRDPTPIFYLMPLISYYDDNKNAYYGFKQISLFLNNEPWWFHVPVVPTAKIVLQKVEISEGEFQNKQEQLDNILYSWN